MSKEIPVETKIQPHMEFFIKKMKLLWRYRAMVRSQLGKSLDIFLFYIFRQGFIDKGKYRVIAPLYGNTNCWLLH